MRCPTLEELPPPPIGRNGWPWTEGTDRLLPDTVDGNLWPKISVVTPNYNYEQFIEEAIRSVLLQGYPDIEYFVVDDGSTDGSRGIIRKYEKWLTCIEIRQNSGQCGAINEGLKCATGSILACLDSDNYYLPDALGRVAEKFIEDPGTDLIYGRCHYVNEDNAVIGEHVADINGLTDILDVWSVWREKRCFVFPEVFWGRKCMDRTGLFREDLKKVLDYEYWCRMFKVGCSAKKIDYGLARSRVLPYGKAAEKEKVLEEFLLVLREYLWDRQILMPFFARIRLQSKWLYQAVLLKEIERSVAKNENRFCRWGKSFTVILRHGQILFGPDLWRRFGQIRRK